jgi:two-component system, LytTR family, response regulator
MRAVIVDDEPLARVAMRQALVEHADVDIVGEYAGGADALAALPQLAADVVFLDIEMPGGDGLALAEQLSGPLVVFVTAHADHALRAFDADALGYLLKPLDQDRVDRTLERLRAQLRGRTRHLARLCVRAEGRAILLATDQLDWLAADGNYVIVHAAGEAYAHRTSLAALEARLDPNEFVRIGRSTLVRAGSVVELADARVKLRDGTALRVSRRFRGRVLAALAPVVTRG